jgi:hypothetical protein
MKTYVTYGFIWALAGALLTLALYFLGYHSAAEKLKMAGYIGMVGGLAICVVCIILGTKARRTEVPATEPFGYGQALGAAMMVAVFATLFGAVFNFLYMHFINPGMKDLQIQAQIDAWQAAGMSSAQIETAEKMMRTMMNPAVGAVMFILFALFFSLIVALITSAFLKRDAVAAEPPVTA